MNITDILASHARNRPTHPAIVDRVGTINYRDLDTLVTASAARLHGLGVEKSDLVGVALPSTVEHLLVLYGLARLGAVLMPIDPSWNPADVETRLRNFGVGKLITAQGAKALQAGTVIRVDPSWREPCEGLEPPVFPREDDLPFLLVLSSGTTGMPKGPMISHVQAEQRMMSGIVNWGLSPWDRYASVIPLCFNMGRANCMTVHQLGGTVVMFPEDISTEDVAEAFRSAGISWAFLTPHHLRLLLDQAGDDEPLMPFVRQLIVATAPLFSDERERARRLITPNFFESYGSNECGLYAMSSPEDQIRKPDSVGRIIAGIDAEIVDENHNSLPSGQIGMIRLRGPGFPEAYFNNPEATAEVFRDGWFYPGDAALVDEDGFVFLKGRSDDVIIFDGINIYPADIEDALVTHSAVEEAAVVGHVTKSRREVPVAFVVLSEQVKPVDLRRHCERTLTNSKWPHAIVPVRALPRNEIGKVLKTDLKKLAKQHLSKL